MASLIRKLPFFEKRTTVQVGGQDVLILPRQIIVWVSIDSRDIASIGPDAPRIPAVLDIGFNESFVIRQQQVLRWTGLPLHGLRAVDTMDVRGEPAPVFPASLWLHRNQPGQRDEFSDRPPFRLPLDEGIAVCPAGAKNAPRLPLLGMRALRRSRLQLHVDFDACHVSIRTTTWLTRLLRLFG